MTAYSARADIAATGPELLPERVYLAMQAASVMMVLSLLIVLFIAFRRPSSVTVTLVVFVLRPETSGLEVPLG